MITRESGEEIRMFGYVKTYKPDMRIAEFETYRGVYCSLCQTLGKRYGFAARMTLSYDFTFLALLILALQDEKVTFRKGHCPYNPVKKRVMCYHAENEALNYAADTAMLLVYHKLSDTIRDERLLKRWKARAARWFVKRDYKKACKRRPEEAKAVLAYMAAQAVVEREKTVSVDAAAEPTARLLSTLISSRVTQVDREVMERFGYCLGRFIYLADAADDLEEDLKTQNYNPYILSADMSISNEKQLQEVRSYAAESLHNSMAVCAECYEQMPVKRFDGILRNIIYRGVPAVIQQIQNGKTEEQCHEESI